MAENEDGQERSEQATHKRLEDARKKGQVPRSRELASLGMMFMAAVSLSTLGEGMIKGLGDVARMSLDADRDRIFNPTGGLDLLIEMLIQAFWLLLPFLTIMVMTAVAVSIALGGISFSLQAIAFKLDKLNPLSGLKRIFAVRGVVEMLKSLLKFILIGSIGAALMTYFTANLIGLGRQPLESGLRDTGSILSWSFILLSTSLILIAAIDVPFQLWDHAKNLKMTRQEVKDENKNIEGKPEVKSRIRTMQRQIAQSRMMAEVPTADVVITNPSHYAIALRYDADKMAAPIVVAKGIELVAGHIRKVADANNVPLFEAPPLARALYYSTEINAPVPAGLYLSVAQILAYVYQLKATKQGGPVPNRPSDLEVPDEFYQGE